MSVRNALMWVLWGALTPVVLTMAMIMLDAKLPVLVLGMAIIVGLPALVAYHSKKLAAASRPPTPRFDDEPGWEPLRKTLMRDIDAVAAAHGVVFCDVQVKEKWGRLKVIWSVTGDDVTACDAAKAEIRELIDAAGDRSEKICVRCGKPAIIGKADGRILPLCPEHTPRDAEDADAAKDADGIRLLLQQWEESEREEGWGVTVRPDGYSVHRTPAAWEAYMQTCWEGMPDKTGGRAPDIYSRPSGEPVAATVASNHPLALALADRDSQRLFPRDENTETACFAAEQIWHAVAPGRGWHVDRDWPKQDSNGTTKEPNMDDRKPGASEPSRNGVAP